VKCYIKLFSFEEGYNIIHFVIHFQFFPKTSKHIKMDLVHRMQFTIADYSGADAVDQTRKNNYCGGGRAKLKNTQQLHNM
jgi:hypothetical protein